MSKKYDDYGIRAEDTRAKFQVKMAAVKKFEEEAVSKKETSFLGNVEKLDTARNLSSKHWEELADNTKQRRTKQEEKYFKNRDSERQAFRQKIKDIRAKTKNDAPLENKAKHLQETTEKRAASRQIMHDLVDSNRARINRSAECSREQTLTKIQMTKARLDNILQQREHIVTQRMTMLRESMVEKARLEKVMQTMRDASPRKVNRVLQDLGMQAAFATEAKEGDESQQQQQQQQ